MNKIIVIEGNDTILENILSLIQRSDNKKKHVIPSNKRRKTDLTCVICESRCSGYNLNVISCESCKSFFHRNMSQNLNDLKCLTNTNKCRINFEDQRRMCRRCRLGKCLSAGMKRNYVNEGNQIIKTNIKLIQDDYNRLQSIRHLYEDSFEWKTIKRDGNKFRHIIDRRSAFLHMLADMYDDSLRLIKFIRNIPEFKLLNEQDRFILVQYNSPIMIFMYFCLNYDMNRDLVINTSAEDEEYALVTNQWRKYHCGEQFHSQTNKMFRSIKEITNNDPIIIQMLMIIFLFSKSLSFEDAVMIEHSSLQNDKQIFEAQSMYTNLLFRYMIEKYSTYDQAVRHYAKLIHKVVQIIGFSWNYRQILENELIDVEIDKLNPILKSILRLN